MSRNKQCMHGYRRRQVSTREYVIAELDFAHRRLWAAWSEFHDAAAEVAEMSLWFKFSHPLGRAEGRRLLSSIDVCVPCDAGHNICWCDPLWV